MRIYRRGGAVEAVGVRGSRLLLVCAVAAASLVRASDSRGTEYAPVTRVGQPNSGSYDDDAVRPAEPFAVPAPAIPDLDVGSLPRSPLGESSAATTALELAAPALEVSFEGVRQTGFLYPPDPVIATGPSSVLVVTNDGLALFGKSGVSLARRSLVRFFNASTGALFDPQVLYDPHSSRFVVLVLDGLRSSPSSLRIAVSKSDAPQNLYVGASAAEAWWAFDIRADLDGAGEPSGTWADFPGLGVDQFNVYVTANMVPIAGSSWGYAKIWIIPKAELMGGAPITVYEFGAPPGPTLHNPVTNFPDFSIRPALNFDLAHAQYMLATVLPGFVTRWTVENLQGTPALSAVNLSVPGWSPVFTEPDCPQLGGGTPIDTGTGYLLQAVQRGGHIWTAHLQTEPTATRTGVRWYEIDPLGPSLVQHGDVMDSARCYFYPAIHPDAWGNACMVMSGVDSTIYGSAFYTCRESSDPPGMMRGVAPLQFGLSSAGFIDTGFGFVRNRWGDYGGIAADPATGDIWMVHEYMPAGGFGWSTWVGRLTAGPRPTILGRSFQLKDPSPLPGGDAARRTVRLRGHERGSPDTIVGDPAVSGARLRIIARGNTDGDQTFFLPAAGWERVPADTGRLLVGYKYLDGHPGAYGPVRSALIKRNPGSGLFRFRATITGENGSGPQPRITLVPPDPGNEAGAVFTIANGGSYCLSFGGAAGGMVVDRGNRFFEIVSHAASPTVEAGCLTPPPTTTTTSLPRVCGDGVVSPGESCDWTASPSGCPPGRSCEAFECDCLIMCGDGEIGAGEVCDPSGSTVGCAAGETCDYGCTACVVQCGDGVVGAGETCDPPLSVSGCPAGETCNYGCACAVQCGDGVVGAGEVCDPPGSTVGCPTGRSCDFSCASCASVCGDGLVVSPEVCDPPGSTAGCAAGETCYGCTFCLGVCGDGVVGAGEICDPPGSTAGCPAGQSCDLSCSCAP